MAEEDREGRRLRERAEELLAVERTEGAPLSEHEVKGLLHELHVHQVELEMQNEDLRQAQVDLAASLERYADLYEFAPVRYLSVGLDGLITRANLAAADLLGVERRRLTGKSLARFIAPEDKSRYQGMRRRLVIPGLNESAEMVVLPTGGKPLWARLEIITRQDASEGAIVWQVAISNIDAQKRAELTLQRVNEELEQQVERRTGQLALANRHLVEEISLRREAEAELRERGELLERRVLERTAALAALLSVARDISSQLEVDGILGIILQELGKILRYDGCGIFLLDGKVLTLVAYSGPLPKEELLRSQMTLDESPLLAAVIERGAPITVVDMNADTPLARQWRDDAGALQRRLMGQSRAWLGVPMITHGRPVGVMQLDHPAPGYFTEEHANLVLTLASQAAVAVVNARLYAQARRVAVIEERQRLARELHDSVAQTFYSIALAAHSGKAQLREKPEIVEQRLEHILQLTEAGLTEMKALIFDLQVDSIRRDGLVQALCRHVDAITARNDLRVQAELGTEPDAALEAKEAIYRITREALQNVVRHANATELSLRLGQDDDVLCLEVRDNGKGFAAGSAGKPTLGLSSMRERAALAGGSVEIDSVPGKGSVVRARIPVRAG